MPSVHFLCKKCERRMATEASERAAPCEHCGTESGVVAPTADRPVQACAACGEREMYVQKDFNRATGIALVVVGAIFVPWTWGLSLLGVTIVDLFLYYKLGEVTVCYACRAVHRGYPLNPAHKPFDLVLHDRHVYGAAPPGAEENL
jgi:hypothetical protein